MVAQRDVPQLQRLPLVVRAPAHLVVTRLRHEAVLVVLGPLQQRVEQQAALIVVQHRCQRAPQRLGALRGNARNLQANLLLHAPKERDEPVLRGGSQGGSTPAALQSGGPPAAHDRPGRSRSRMCVSCLRMQQRESRRWRHAQSTRGDQRAAHQLPRSWLCFYAVAVWRRVNLVLIVVYGHLVGCHSVRAVFRHLLLLRHQVRLGRLGILEITQEAYGLALRPVPHSKSS